MFNFLKKSTPLSMIFDKDTRKAIPAKEAIAEILKTTPEALAAFEASYKKDVLDACTSFGSPFDNSAKDAKSELQAIDPDMRPAESMPELDGIIMRIVKELVGQTEFLRIKDGRTGYGSFPDCIEEPVTMDELRKIPEQLRPQLTGSLMKKDIADESYPMLVWNWKQYQDEKDPRKKRQLYHMFRQGLDILDLDGVLYQMLGTNPNAIGYWLPALAEANSKHGFFKIPDTTVIKVPLTLLQLTRQEYMGLTPTTMKIVDLYCQHVFGLDTSKEYFVKTGTYSSKFDFRNAHVHGEKEVRELGEYLLFIHSQACQMAGPLTQPSIYGMSTTNEWAVREFIPDKNNLPCIYKGMPLRTEYRVFVDFDSDTVLGMSPYWRADIMKQRFGHEDDADSPHQVHDYIIYQMHEEELNRQYEQNKGMLLDHVRKLVPDIDLAGQWSLDIMQDNNDFYLIDMALATQSALSDCVPAGMLKPVTENWLPKIPETV